MTTRKTKRARSAQPKRNPGAARGARLRNKTTEPRPLPAVYADIRYREAATGREVKAVKPLWQKLPAWWNRAGEDQRREFIRGYFQRSLNLQPEDQILSVKVKLPNPARRNKSEDAEIQAAAAMSEKFHGRPARKIREFEQSIPPVVTLAELGRLIELQILTPDGDARALEFKPGTRLACNPSGTQLYIVGGDQEPPFKSLGIAAAGRDYLIVGEVHKIVYATRKAFHNFENAEYIHEFGEDGGERPVLGYGREAGRLFLIGGSYRVKPEGIVN